MHKDLSAEYFKNQMEHLLADDELKNGGITLVLQETDFAVIIIPVGKTGRNIHLKIENINFDLDPLHFYFVDPVNFKNLPPELYPVGSGIADGHDMLPNPVICISSTYSYHTHPSHRNSPFDKYRNNFILAGQIKNIKQHIDNVWTIPEGGCLS
ncbi:hypothetical protein KCX82_11945 [Clostridiales bacterium BAD-6]|uniref:Uncharacterized protein n=2 Tax=Sinanaerobacter chloroacetimidivorans TaxID=2818044 RepID=A0A8J7W3Q1_9FIRM|nr:hypothetical protein [Sinanaerobacter chloroacetimidivorans]